MSDPLRPIGGALAAVAAKLAPQAARKAHFTMGTPWLPGIEREAECHSVRMRGGPEAIAAYRHALAVTRNQAARCAVVRVHVRVGDKLHAFDCRLDEINTQTVEEVAPL
jgi:hypothetical protein